MMSKFFVVSLLALSQVAHAWETVLPEFSPLLCRLSGVDVKEDALVTGRSRIISIGFSEAPWHGPYHVDPVEHRCPKPNPCLNSCAMVIGTFRGIHQWEIFYRRPADRIHAVCHAEFETTAHTPSFLRDTNGG